MGLDGCERLVDMVPPQGNVNRQQQRLRNLRRISHDLW